MNRLKTAVVGVGALGRHHARILAGLDSVELVAVAEPNPETGKRVAEQCGTVWVPDYQELIDRIDAVSIVVPTHAHLAVARDFLERSVPVMLEKPLAANAEQAARLVEIADQHGALLQVGHIERFNPATNSAWKLCAAPKYIRAERLSPYAFRSTDIGVVHDLMIHDLDLVLDLVQSPVRHVDAFGLCILGGHEDSVQARICFENGCIADLTANRVSPSARRAMQIWSVRGAVSIDFSSRDVVAYSPSDALLYGTSVLERAKLPGADIEQLKQDVFETYLKVTRPEVDDSDALTAELTSFIDCVKNRRPPLVDGHQALRAMEVAEQVLDQVAQHQWDGHADGAIGPFARTPAARKRAG